MYASSSFSKKKEEFVHTMIQQGLQQTLSPVTLEGSMLLFVHPQELPDNEIVQFHPPKAKVYF